jgi:hypothetical protein
MSIDNLGDVKMKKTVDKYANIQDRVSFYIQGKHGKIGVIEPERKTTYEEWKRLNERMAEIIFNDYLSKQGKEGDT